MRPFELQCETFGGGVTVYFSFVKITLRCTADMRNYSWVGAYIVVAVKHCKLHTFEEAL
jgi:hypothetical protein